MSERAVTPRPAGPRLILAIVATVFVAPVLTARVARAQPQATAPSPSFAVASIRVNHSGERIMLYQPARGGRFTATNCSLSLLVQYAYGVRQFQIYGAPDWFKSEHYDLAAKAEGDPPVDDLRVMLQRLLEDRFQLRSHRGTKEAPVYELVVSKAGKLKESGPGDCLPRSEDAPCGGLKNTPGHTKGRQLTAGDIAGSLTFFLGRLVVDKTGLSGKYDIELEWMPESAQAPPSAPSAARTPPAVDAPGPSIFSALQDQLGLRLKSAQGTVETLVIDRVERPSEN